MSTVTSLLLGSVLLFVVLFLTISGTGLFINNPSGTGFETPTTTPDHTFVQYTETSKVETRDPAITSTGAPVTTMEPTLTPSATLTPEPLPTSAETTTAPVTVVPTPTPASDPFANEKYGQFVGAVLGEAEVDAATPIRLRAWKVAEGNSLIVVLNLTSESENDARRAREINTLVTSGFAQAVAHHDMERIDGKITDRLRIAEVNNTGARPKTLIVNTSLAREYYTGQINAVEFTEEYWKTERNMTADEIEFVYNMDMRTGNQTLHNATAD
ncbi:hypothetical protein [Halosimplex carlsbadense]|uniref:hypothetical protein n=1 Tax=Halosimplex carlsbadense TaxID=171164 RepID=UPI0012680ABA|nr:hypothetical protein [Halosimplex carlsbadense]